MRFKIIYSLYVIVCLLYPVLLIIGPISLRHFFTVIILGLCIFEKGLVFDKFLKWFFIFMFFSSIGALVTGYVGEFLNRFLGTYFAAITMYMATKIMIKKYNGGMWILIVILIIAVLNAVTAIGQFYGSPIATYLPMLLRINIDADLIDFYERTTDFQGKYVGGLLGIVLSGYFLAGTCVLALYNGKGTTKVYNWLLFALLFFALFLVQERSGFAAAILCTAVYMVINAAKSKNMILGMILVAIVGVFVVLNYGERLVNIDKMRYSTMGFSDYGRVSLARVGLNYFLENPLGGIDAYHAAGNRDPHNIFVNVFLHGGLFGGLVALGIIITQIYKVAKVLYKSYTKKNSHSLFLNACCIAYLSYIINTFFHNVSMFSGDIMFFILWGMINGNLELEKADTRIPIQRSKFIF